MKFNNLTAVCDFKWKIHNFTEDNIKNNKYTIIDTKFFSILLGEKEKKWKFNLIIRDFGLEIRSKEKSESRDFRVRFSSSIDCKVRNEEDDDYMICFFEEHSSDLEHPRCGLLAGGIDRVFQNPGNYLDNNTLTISFKMELIHGFELDSFDCLCPASSSKTNAHFSELYTSKFLSDFTIICSDGTELQTHRFILAANSPVLRAMLECPMQESIHNKMQIDDIDGKTMNEILRLMYNPYEYFPCNNFMDTFYVLEKYQLQKLKDICINSMIQLFDNKSIFECFMLAEFYNETYLMQRCLMYIKANFYDLCITEDWKNLSVQQLNIIDEYPYDPLVEHYETFL